MTIRITLAQKVWLGKIRGGLSTSPPIPSAVISALLRKNLIVEYRDQGSVVRYKLSEEGWRFF